MYVAALPPSLILHLICDLIVQIQYTIPRNGTLLVLAQLTARILPSVPRTPNPPGTRIPLTKSKVVFVYIMHQTIIFIHIFKL